jgi:tellurite resistance protein
MQSYYSARTEAPLKVFGLSGAARVEALDGRLEDAERCLGRAAEIMKRSPHLPAFYGAAYWNSRLHADLALLEAGESSAGWRISRTMKRALATSRLIARDRPEAYRLAARACWRLRKPAKARRWWKQALAESERIGSRPETARIAADIGLLIADGDDRDDLFAERDSAAWLALAAEEFEALDLDWELLRLQREVSPLVTPSLATH